MPDCGAAASWRPRAGRWSKPRGQAPTASTPSLLVCASGVCPDCLALAEAYPGLKIVFAHLGGGLFLFETMPEVRKALANVCYDTAAVPYLYGADVYGAAVSSAGPEKFIFGSDYPLLSAGRYRESLDRLEPSVRRAIEGDNARRVFGL
jgi:predicted TIM-barrel fold metal-dependent hydrolase